MANNSELLVASVIAGCNQGVMHSRSGVFNDGENGTTIVGDQGVANLRVDLQPRSAAMLHRHRLVKVIRVESPSVDDLLTVCIDHLNYLPLFELDRCTTTSRKAHEFIVLDCRDCVHSDSPNSSMCQRSCTEKPRKSQRNT
ncbi:hypothetical protein D3C84_638050 [compost metagenome]